MVKSLVSRSRHLLQKEHKSILSAAIIIATSYLGSAVLGLIRNRLLAARFFGGLEQDLDVYFASLVIPDSLFQLLVIGSISAAFIPVYQEYLRKSSFEANKMANATLASLGLILGLFVLIVLIFALPLANLITHFPPTQTLLMAQLIRIMLMAQLILTFSAFFTGLLQAHRRFLIPAIAPLFYNLGIIIAIFFFSSQLGIYSAAWGMVAGAILHALIQFPLAKVLGFRLQKSRLFHHPGVTTIMRLMPSRSAALAVTQIERFVSVYLTTTLAAGSLTILNFARQLYVLPISLFGVALGQASFPSLAKEASDNEWDKFIATLSKSIAQIMFFSLPASAILLVLRIPLVRIVFGARQFPWEATLLTAKTLAILSLSIAPQAATQLLTRAFYAKKNTLSPLIVSVITLLIFIFLSFILTRFYSLGILGLAYALTISNLVSFLLLYFWISRQWAQINLGAKISKFILTSAITGIFLWIPMRFLDQFVFDTTKTLPLVALTLVATSMGMLVYLGLSYIFKVEELAEVASLARKIGNWRKILVRSHEVIEAPTTQE